MTRLQLAKKMHRFLALNRIQANKRTAADKRELLALDGEIGKGLELVFTQVGIKAPAGEPLGDDQVDGDE